ncbi:hypothetical protein [Chroococcus sp. FPU101]|uniref:hypothetical protein n=1 Tax=Chroococcus sp. FPU101 TaxID=1974212 RepID=UPI001A8DC1FA|nr:hypothetical protein [Chroococcus sp. FPU101]GFE71797.1 hypothetical protein CFPU101_44070 [Chroococcus sp. FPU101]
MLDIVKVTFRRVIIPGGLEVIMEIWPPIEGRGHKPSIQVCCNSPDPDPLMTKKKRWRKLGEVGYLQLTKRSPIR